MADVAINADGANIPSVNFGVQGSDVAAPGSGRAQLYVKAGGVYVRYSTGDPTALGGGVTLAEGQLAIGDGDGALAALDLGEEGQVVTADGSGFAAWADAPAGAGALSVIEHKVFGAAEGTSWTSATIPGTYEALLIEWSVDVARSAYNNATWFLRFNGDTGAHYCYRAESNAVDQGQASLGLVSTNGSTSSRLTSEYLKVPRYANATRQKQAHGESGYFTTNNATYSAAQLLYCWWNQTSAITTVTLYTSNGTVITEGSTITLYGLSSA